jgi:hypothetical protein
MAHADVAVLADATLPRSPEPLGSLGLQVKGGQQRVHRVAPFLRGYNRLRPVTGYIITAVVMMPVMPHGPDQIAPGELELVREFVNTRDVELASDRLGTGTEAREWMEEHGLAVGGRLLAAGDLERLTAVREALRALLLANNFGERPAAEALEALNRESAEAAVGLRFDAGGSALLGRG